VSDTSQRYKELLHNENRSQNSPKASIHLAIANVLKGVTREIVYFCSTCITVCGRDSVVTYYGLVVEARWARDFMCHSRPVQKTTQPPAQWVLVLSWGSSDLGVVATPSSVEISNG